ncbi:MAG TPA: aminomethyl-transferring glycine dehydrogenase subunit GcvPA [Rhodospirillaceae bacterium]|nr:aminomethyl-transferring glycine dehydrogenase subunit GcvPA [Rhodospirillaceae bacterium]
MRYLPLTNKDRAEMLDAIGVKDVDVLFKDVPKQAFVDGLVNVPSQKSELEVERIMGDYANQNISAGDGPFFLGAGCYYHHVPASVDYIIQRSEFLTAYTPYQPEIAQGTLQVIFEFQSMIAGLTGQDVANASMYDGATATTEAALMAQRVTKRRNIKISGVLHPDYRKVLDSYMKNFGDVVIAEGEPTEEDACVIVQTPDFYGNVQKLEKLRAACDKTGVLLVVVVTEIVSLGLLPAPRCADIVCGEGQSIGLPMSYGGPHLGFFAAKEKYLRQMPGRLCGETVDAEGRRSFVLTLNTREQHIRREKATSNICTNQGLCALAFTVHMALLGEDGFKRLARINHERAGKLYDALTAFKKVKLLNKTFFNEFTIELPKDAAPVVEAMVDEGVMAGYAHQNKLIVAATEMTSDADIEHFVQSLEACLG